MEDKDFLTDAEMAELETSSQEEGPDFISDAEMAELEAQGESLELEPEDDMGMPRLKRQAPIDPNVNLMDPQVPQSESFARGAAQTLSLGFMDEASAYVTAVIGGDPILGLELPQEKFMDRVNAAKEFYREKNRVAQESNPGTYFAGEVTGALAGPGKFVSGGKTLASGLARGAASGAVIGAGTSEADLTEGELPELARDMAVGGTLGAFLNGVGRYAGNKLQQRQVRNLSKVAEKRVALGQEIRETALRESGVTRTLAAAKKEISNVEKLGDEIAFQPIFGKSESYLAKARTPQELLALAKEEIATVGSRLGAVRSEATAKGATIPASEIIQQVKSLITPTNKPLLGKIDKQISQWANEVSQGTGNIPLTAITDMKSFIQNSISGVRGISAEALKSSPVKTFQSKIGAYLKEKEVELIRKHVPNQLDDYQRMLNRYGIASTVKKGAIDLEGKRLVGQAPTMVGGKLSEEAQNILDMGSRVVGGVATGVTGSPLIGGATGHLTERLVRRFGFSQRPLSGETERLLALAARLEGKAAAQKRVVALAKDHERLFMKTGPEAAYRLIIDNLGSEEKVRDLLGTNKKAQKSKKRNLRTYSQANQVAPPERRYLHPVPERRQLRN